jgi:hypothetical protein
MVEIEKARIQLKVLQHGMPELRQFISVRVSAHRQSEGKGACGRRGERGDR